MSPKIRAVLGVLAGMVSGTIVIGGIEMFNPLGVPAGTVLETNEQLEAYMKTLPFTAFLPLLVALFLGAGVAGFVANWICKPTKYRPAMIAGLGLFVAGVMNLIAIPHPLWFSIVSSLLTLLGAWAGGKAVGRTAN